MFKTNIDGCEPSRGTKYSAGIDLRASKDVTIKAGETVVVGLGVAIDHEWIKGKCSTDENLISFLETTYLELHPRSGLRAKGIVSNTGIIDADYEDEIKIILHYPVKTKEVVNITTLESSGNSSVVEYKDTFEIKKGDRIAQILIKQHNSYLAEIESDDVRDGGLGSTGDN